MGLRKLKELGVAVFRTKEEEESESIEEKQRWARPALHKLLAKGPGFRVTPGMITKEEKGAGVLRCAVGIVRRVSQGIREEAIGKQDTKANEWEKEVGINKDTYKRAKGTQARGEEEWQSTLDGEIKEGIGLSFWPQGAAKKMRIDLPGLHEEMTSFVSAWNDEEPVQLAQLDSMQEKEKEERERDRSKHEKKRRQESLNISGRELRELKELKEHEKEFHPLSLQTGGSCLIPRASAMVNGRAPSACPHAEGARPIG